MIVRPSMHNNSHRRFGVRACSIVALGALLLVSCNGPERTFEEAATEYQEYRQHNRRVISDIDAKMKRIASGERPASISPKPSNMTLDMIAWSAGGGAAMPPACAAEPNPDACWGEQVYKGNCAQCHSVDGSAGSGPTWVGLYGKQRNVVNSAGEKYAVVADDEYLLRSITNPASEIVVEYLEGQQMASQAHLKEPQLVALVEYIKALGTN